MAIAYFSQVEGRLYESMACMERHGVKRCHFASLGTMIRFAAYSPTMSTCASAFHPSQYSILMPVLPFGSVD